jgi:hypothetical protein
MPHQRHLRFTGGHHNRGAAARRQPKKPRILNAGNKRSKTAKLSAGVKARTSDAPLSAKVGPSTPKPLQEVRYLRVSNQTGQAIRVYVKEDGETRSWDFAAGQTAYLEIEGEEVAASEVLLWATSDDKSWMDYRDSPLVLVSEPYPCYNIATYTHTFR